MPQLATESVDVLSLPLQGIDDICGEHGASVGVLHEDEGVADDSIEPVHENVSGAWVDASRNSLDSAPSGDPSDITLGDTELELMSGLGFLVLVALGAVVS